MLDALTTARDWKRRPTEILGGVSSVGDALSEADRLLMIALTLHEASKCPCGVCGGYADEMLTSDGHAKVKQAFCDGKAAMDDFAKDNPEPEPGELRYVVFDEADD